MDLPALRLVIRALMDNDVLSSRAELVNVLYELQKATPKIYPVNGLDAARWPYLIVQQDLNGRSYPPSISIPDREAREQASAS